MSSQIDREYLVPLLCAGCRQAAPGSNTHVEHHAVNPLQVANRPFHQPLTILFPADVGNHHAGRAAFLHNLIACLPCRGFILIHTCHRSAFSGAQQSNRATIAHRRIGLITRLRSRAHHQDARPLQSSATRRSSPRLCRRPYGCTITACNRLGGLFRVFSHSDPASTDSCSAAGNWCSNTMKVALVQPKPTTLVVYPAVTSISVDLRTASYFSRIVPSRRKFLATIVRNSFVTRSASDVNPYRRMPSTASI